MVAGGISGSTGYFAFGVIPGRTGYPTCGSTSGPAGYFTSYQAPQITLHIGGSLGPTG